MKHTISILVDNHAGVLSRITGLFSRRGFNIDSLAVGVTDNIFISRITIVVDGNDYVIEQVEKQLNKLVDVIKLRRLPPQGLISRELALIKLYKNKLNPDTVTSLGDICRQTSYDCSDDMLILELCETSDLIEQAIGALPNGSIAELVRTGVVALNNGNSIIACD